MPLTPPTTVAEGWSSCLVNVTCPITALAACPVVKSAAHATAAHRTTSPIHFMRDIKGRVVKLALILNYSKGLRHNSETSVVPRRHTREAQARQRPVARGSHTLRIQRNPSPTSKAREWFCTLAARTVW